MSAGRRGARVPSERRHSGTTGTVALHFVLAELVRIQRLEPLLESIRVLLLVREVHGLRVVDDPLIDENRRARSEGQRDRIARPRVDRDGSGWRLQVERVEGEAGFPPGARSC